jgi:hypothetical protein
MRTRLMLPLAALGASTLSAQMQAAPAPQTARQALIEMFVGDGTDAFAKHLPDSARKVLLHNGELQYTSAVLRMSTMGRQLIAQGGRVETFEDGPTILVSEQGQGLEKTEVIVERDSVSGETDEIELSTHSYHDGQEQFLPVIPRFIFTMRQEKNVWRLVEVTASARVPLTDPDYLSGLLRQQQEANESAVQMRINSIATAETGYAARHPDRGYSCTLTTLFTPEPADDSSSDDDPVAPQVYYDPGQGNSEWDGYRFTLVGCEGSPAARYHITAVPIDSDSGTKAFCADESGALKSLSGGNSSACLTQGEVLRPPTDAAPEPVPEKGGSKK